MDPALSRDRAKILLRYINSLRHYFDVEVIENTNDEFLLSQVKQGSYLLLMAPWNLYLKWKHIEGAFGLNRTSGPTFAGYYAEPFSIEALGDSTDYSRLMIFDLYECPPKAAAAQIVALAVDQKRSGLLPLQEGKTPVYYENWFTDQGMGSRMDALFQLPELKEEAWKPVSNRIRILLLALWDLVYEEGPGKGQIAQAGGKNSPKAYFQMTSTPHGLFFRLMYSIPAWNTREVIRQFWPTTIRRSKAADLLFRYSDFIRIHTFKDSHDLEFTVGIMQHEQPPSGSFSFPTLWIEPLSPNLLKEFPFLEASADHPHLKPLPTFSVKTEAANPDQTQKKDRLLAEAAQKIKELKSLVQERDDIIKDMRSGGVTTAKPLPILGPEEHLEAFQEKFFEARFQIRQFELQIVEIQQNGAETGQIQKLNTQMTDLINQEKTWIQKLGETIQSIKEARKSGT